jgi:hypothetical protein
MLLHREKWSGVERVSPKFFTFSLKNGRFQDIGAVMDFSLGGLILHVARKPRYCAQGITCFFHG